MSFRIGIDVGGTFTDLAVMNESTGELVTTKSPTTPEDYLQGILNCLKKVDVDKKKVSYIVHGTTTVTNAIVQRRLDKTALITTKGFRDVLEIMRQNRPLWGLFDIQWVKPQPLVPRYLRFELDERVDSEGNVLKPVDAEEVRRIAVKLREFEVRSVAICLIFGHLNSRHEKEVRKIIQKEAPEIYVSLSSEVNPQVREYERTSTTTINATTKPLAKEYFARLKDGLKTAGFKSNLLITKSSGGLLSVEQAGEFPVYTIESGPVGGTLGSAYLGKLIGRPNLIAIDMGGTTFKVSIVDHGVPKTRSEGEIEWGIPYRTPMVDISEIGSGGGSIAYIDREGLLRVGPQSAGAEPGPVCYGKGGVEPTFTDACLVLGYLNEDSLLGGEMKVDKRAAETAITSKIASPLGMDLLDAAYGIVEISNRLMLGSMQISSVEKGYDPRDFSTIAYGGAGPMVASYLAGELGSPELIVPEHPGIFSALGMLLADIRLDFMHPFERRATDVDPVVVEGIYRALEARATRELKKDFDLRYKLARSADMRYVGQNYDISVDVPPEKFDEKVLRKTEANFTHAHQRLFGHAQGAEKQFANLRVTITGMIDRPPFQVAKKAGKAPEPKDSRLVCFGRGERVDSEVYDRGSLGRGSVVKGPCIVEGPDSTVVVRPGQRATVDKYANLIIKTR